MRSEEPACCQALAECLLCRGKKVLRGVMIVAVRQSLVFRHVAEWSHELERADKHGCAVSSDSGLTSHACGNLMNGIRPSDAVHYGIEAHVYLVLQFETFCPEGIRMCMLWVRSCGPSQVLVLVGLLELCMQLMPPVLRHTVPVQRLSWYPVQAVYPLTDDPSLWTRTMAPVIKCVLCSSSGPQIGAHKCMLCGSTTNPGRTLIDTTEAGSSAQESFMVTMAALPCPNQRALISQCQ